MGKKIQLKSIWIIKSYLRFQTTLLLSRKINTHKIIWAKFIINKHTNLLKVISNS